MSVVSIGEVAFTDCAGLTPVNYIGEIKDWMKIRFGVIPLQNGNVKFYLNGQELIEINESDLDGATEIPAYAFSNISGLSVLKNSDSITTLGNWHFMVAQV